MNTANKQTSFHIGFNFSCIKPYKNNVKMWTEFMQRLVSSLQCKLVLQNTCIWIKLIFFLSFFLSFCLKKHLSSIQIIILNIGCHIFLNLCISIENCIEIERRMKEEELQFSSTEEKRKDDSRILNSSQLSLSLFLC